MRLLCGLAAPFICSHAGSGWLLLPPLLPELLLVVVVLHLHTAVRGSAELAGHAYSLGG